MSNGPDRYITRYADGVAKWHAVIFDDAAGALERGQRADIRRARDPMEIMMTAAFGRLVAEVEPVVRSMGTDMIDARRLKLLSLTAFIASKARKLSATAPSIGRQMGRIVNDRALISATRATTLLSSGSADDAAERIRSIVPVLSETNDINPADVLFAMYRWVEHRKKWAMDYHSQKPL